MGVSLRQSQVSHSRDSFTGNINCAFIVLKQLESKIESFLTLIYWRKTVAFLIQHIHSAEVCLSQKTDTACSYWLWNCRFMLVRSCGCPWVKQGSEFRDSFKWQHQRVPLPLTFHPNESSAHNTNNSGKCSGICWQRKGGNSLYSFSFLSVSIFPFPPQL